MAAYQSDFIAPWQRVAARRKPIIAAVAGYALGGGCELAMMCDVIIAADNAQVRPARDQSRHPARRRRHPAADPGGRQVQGDGDGPHRPHDGRRGGRAGQPRGAGRAGSPICSTRRSSSPRRSPRSRSRSSPWPRRRSTSPTRPACRRAFGSSAVSFTPHSRAKIARRACRPSSRSAPRSSTTADRAFGPLVGR